MFTNTTFVVPRPEDIDVVLCTHMHVDHVGWNTYKDESTGKFVPSFPSSEVRCFATIRSDYASAEPHPSHLSPKIETRYKIPFCIFIAVYAEHCMPNLTAVFAYQ